jgi:hypothetical protein
VSLQQIFYVIVTNLETTLHISLKKSNTPVLDRKNQAYMGRAGTSEQRSIAGQRSVAGSEAFS